MQPSCFFLIFYLSRKGQPIYEQLGMDLGANIGQGPPQFKKKKKKKNYEVKKKKI
jgi:hypothetical protein